ncbi:putative metalloreductase [Thermoascus aurantiacus ATCC 26904]
MGFLSDLEPEAHNSTYDNTTYVYEYSRGLSGVDVPRDVLITQILCVSIGFVAVIVFCGRVAQMSLAYLRQIYSLTATKKQQTFWSIEGSPLWANVKKHLLYAPLAGKRHNREIQLSSALNMGTIPSRFQTILLTLYIASQIAYCSILDYKVNEKAALIAELRGRSGVLSVLNMVPLFMLAGRNNPLIPLLHVSFDTYNLFHRWLGRIVVLEAVTHTIAWAINACDEQDCNDMLHRVATTPFFSWGTLGTCAMIVLFFHSWSPLRHAFYETFLHIHQLFALLAFVGVYVHLKLDSLPQVPWAKFMMSIWIIERGMRLLRLLYLNVSLKNGRTKLVVEALPGEACRVTFHLPRRVHIGPGCHVYAYIPSIALWMSHPFSVAWVEPISCVTRLPLPESSFERRRVESMSSRLEKQDFVDLDRPHDNKQPTTVSLIVAARTGMTRKLYNKALSSPQHTFHASGYIEGPYPSHPSSMGSYGTAVLFSAGAGITHHMLHVRDLLMRAAEGLVATHKIYLIWSVRSTEHLTWVQQWMDSILQLPNRREVLVIKLFVSKPKSSREISSPSSTVQMFPGRCRPDVVLDEVLPKRVGATVVSVCGPGAFADEVRAAARSRVGQGMVIDFVEEAFTW